MAVRMSNLKPESRPITNVVSGNGRRRFWRNTMMSRLLVSIGELEQRRLTVGFSEERDAHRQIVGSEPGRYGDGGRIDQERIQRRYPFVVHVRRIDPILYICGLVLDRFMHYRIQLVVRHYFHDRDRQ